MRVWDKLAKLKKDYSNVCDGVPKGRGMGFFMGKGADGVLQPEKPAGIDYSSGRAVMLHEGELVEDTPRGRLVVPAMMNPINTPQEQAQAQQMEQELKLPGMATGGLIQRDGTLRGFNPLNKSLNTQPQPINRLAVQPSNQTPITPPAKPLIQTNTPQSTLSNIPAVGKAVAPVQAAPIQKQSLGFNQNQVAPKKKEPIGFNTINKVAQGDKSYLDDIYSKLNNQYMGRLGARQAAQTSAQAQQNAQMGLSDSVKNTLGAVQGREQNMEAGAIQSDLATQQAQQQVAEQKQAIQQVIQNKKESIQNLINLGGVENLKQAEQFAKEVYGTDVYGLGNIANDQKMTALAKYTAIPGMSAKGALELAIQNGDLDRYGMTEEEAKNIIAPLVLGSDPVYQAKGHYGDLLDKGLITASDYKDAVDLVKWASLNPDGIEIMDSFVVTDKEGNEVGNFKTQEEANAFMQKNAGDFTVQKKDNGYIGYKGDYQEFLPAAVGDVWQGQDGGLYINMNGEKVPATPIFEDPFAAQNNRILDYYTTHGIDNDVTRQIRTAQLRAANADPLSLPVGLNPNSALYSDLTNSAKATSWDGLKEQSEQGTGSDSHVYNPVLEQLPDNSFINVDGELWLLKSNTLENQSGDDIHTYTLYNPVTGGQKTIKTTANKHQKAVVTETDNGKLFKDNYLKQAMDLLNPKSMLTGGMTTFANAGKEIKNDVNTEKE
jgi:hypothetical protein